MALGKPAVPTVKDNAQRTVEGAFAAVRQRLTAIESQLGDTTKQAGATSQTLSQANSSTSNLQQQISDLTKQVAALQQASASPVVTYTAIEAINANDPVRLVSDTGAASIDTQDPSAMFNVVGIATASAAAGANVTVRRSGLLSIPSAAFESGRAVYADNGTGLTQFPSYAAVALPVGVALSPTTMTVVLGWPALIDQPPYPDYDDFVPVTLRLLRDALDMLTYVPDPDTLSPVSGLVGDELVTVKHAGADFIQATAQQIADLSTDVPDPETVSPVSGLSGHELLTLKVPGGGYIQVTLDQLLAGP